jgi:hypothetical protein
MSRVGRLQGTAVHSSHFLPSRRETVLEPNQPRSTANIQFYTPNGIWSPDGDKIRVDSGPRAGEYHDAVDLGCIGWGPIGFEGSYAPETPDGRRGQGALFSCVQAYGMRLIG